MERKTKLMVVVSIMTGAWIMAACSGAAATTPTEASAPESISTAPSAAMVEPSVDVVDQDASAGEVTVPEVISDGAGWMVIHATTADGKPGAILGKTHVADGQTRDVMVQIDLSHATPQLFAMLHVDAGEVGKFEFPDGVDVPVKLGDRIVNVPFQVTLPVEESTGATLTLVDTSVGRVLADSKGMSLYLFGPDDQGESTCYDACADNWPPLVSNGEPTVGTGLDSSLLGSITRTDGSSQLTYAGWPLYYFARDAEPGDINGQGVNDVWYLVSADGSAALGGVGGAGY
jgi:predicted lipoprotein with Yx(FWY)xxD motif